MDQSNVRGFGSLKEMHSSPLLPFSLAVLTRRFVGEA
jgi:hypothetical protein